MELEKKHNNSHHHGQHKSTVRGYYPRDEQLFWVILAVFAVIPLMLLIQKIQRKISERCKSPEQNIVRRRSRQESWVNDVDSVFSITNKQDYKNLAPPRYSAIYPTPVTYVEPPPYSTAIRIGA